MTEPEPKTLTLDREPFGPVETELVAGFSQIPELSAIWVRTVPTMLTGGYELLRVYLAFSVLDQAGRHEADRRQEAFETRHYYTPIEFEWHHIPEDRIPKDVPARIWKRPPKIWTPESHRQRLWRK